MFKREVPDKFTEFTSSQRAYKGKNYTKNNQSLSANLINITP